MQAVSDAPSVISLVEQIERLSPPAEQPSPYPEQEEGLALFDGYQRSSPVQVYRVPPEYRRKRRMKIILTIALVVAVVALVVVFAPRLSRLVLRMFR